MILFRHHYDKFFLILLIGIFFLFIVETPGEILGQQNTNYNDTKNKTTLSIGGIELLVDLATTSEDQSKGLSIKDNMSELNGMLFVFDTLKKHSFWMKDMKFPIDIIWIDENHKIVHIEKKLEPCLFLIPCPSFSPEHDSLYVLEVVANFTNKYNINKGDLVEFDLKNNINH